jgi:hypothetical protein
MEIYPNPFILPEPKRVRMPAGEAMTGLLHLLVFDKETGMERKVAVDVPSHLCVCVCVCVFVCTVHICICILLRWLAELAR